jgi:hypothetical protein
MVEASPHCGAVAVAELEVVGLSKSRGQSSPVVEGGHEGGPAMCGDAARQGVTSTIGGRRAVGASCR